MTSLREIFRTDTAATEELELNIRPDYRDSGPGSGYVVDCLRSARWCVDVGGYEQIVRSGISLGNDTDTTACVAGGIAGLRDGIGAIPMRWVDALRGRDLWEPLLDRCLARW